MLREYGLRFSAGACQTQWDARYETTSAPTAAKPASARAAAAGVHAAPPPPYRIPLRRRLLLFLLLPLITSVSRRAQLPGLCGRAAAVAADHP
jgi:hypothetical protein